jgi:hypothetical protein
MSEEEVPMGVGEDGEEVPGTPSAPPAPGGVVDPETVPEEQSGSPEGDPGQPDIIIPEPEDPMTMPEEGEPGDEETGAEETEDGTPEPEAPEPEAPGPEAPEESESAPAEESLTEPLNVVATAGAGEVTVTWEAPATGTATGYRVDVHRVSDNVVSKTADADGAMLTATVTGLTNGTSYYATVVAFNDEWEIESESTD